jgi:hypothetical protein
MKTARNTKRVIANRIQAAYNDACRNIEISIWDIAKVFTVGEASIAAGDDDATLTTKIRNFVETIRKN